MNTERIVDRENLLNYLVLDAAKRPREADEQVAVIADSIENELAPALRQLCANQPPSPYEGEPECQSAVFKLAHLSRLPFTESGVVRVLREYELQDELGSGGMGTVYRAQHTKLGKWFAVKVLSPKLPHNPETVSRFLCEMRAAGKIEHKNVVCATDAGEVDGIHYLVMEMVEGLNLSQLVKAVGPLAVADAGEIARLGALGLHAIHAHGLIHRDVKPSNLMLETPEFQIPGQEQVDSAMSRSSPAAHPTVKVLDLGLALLHDTSLTSESGDANRVVGTKQYMAPEQFLDSHNVDARADLYGLGCTLYYLLAGRPPCPRSSPLAGSEEVRCILDRLLAHDPDDRFASATDVAAALKPLCGGADLKGLAVRARKSSAAELDTVTSLSDTRDPATGPLRDKSRGRRRAGLFIAAIILLLGCAVFATWSITRNRSGELVLAIDDPDAVVWIDSEPASGVERKETGELSLRLPVGKHRIRIQAKGQQPWSEKITINNREPQRIVVRLVPQTNAGIADAVTFADNVDARERQLAEWVLQRGGGLKLYPGGDITRLEELPDDRIRIQKIVLGRKNVGDEDATRFPGMSNLQSLDLSHNQLTDRSVELLSQITTLRWLYLDYNHGITDAAGDHLAKLEDIESLDLRSTQITDKTIARLIHLSKLRELRVAHTQVTDQSLVDIGKIPTLVRVDLTGTCVTDQNLFHLRELPKLKYLLLGSTCISDDAVDVLKSLPTVRELDVSNTDLSSAAVQELRTALPQCQVIFQPPNHSQQPQESPIHD